jgi:hypothetical protein
VDDGVGKGPVLGVGVGVFTVGEFGADASVGLSISGMEGVSAPQATMAKESKRKRVIRFIDVITALVLA